MFHYCCLWLDLLFLPVRILIKGFLIYTCKLYQNMESNFKNYSTQIWPNGNIINLSKHSFTKEQYDLLNKYLNFCHLPGDYKKSTLKKDLESFNRKIKLEAFLHNKNVQKQETELANKEPNIKSKINWEPKNHNVETFTKASIKILWNNFQIKRNFCKII